MKRFMFFIPVIFLFAGEQSVYSQALQLPEFQYTTVNTTVSVPDRGSTYMGGVNRSAWGNSQAGVPMLPFQNRSFGRTTSATGMSTSVYIHDFQEMEEQLLNQPTSPAGYGGRPMGGSMTNLKDNILAKQQMEKTRPAASPEYTLGGRANRALGAKRENAALGEALNLEARETSPGKR